MYQPTVNTLYEIARQSECTRRKYGAVITGKYSSFELASGYNKRVGTCCNGVCARDSLSLGHGQNTDAGAEIHAEQMALIEFEWDAEHASRIYVAGLDKDGNPMNGFDNAPCYSCARMIKYAGIQDVYLPVDGEFERFDIDDIMETWERTWS